mgnify:CR=1 FL=1
MRVRKPAVSGAFYPSDKEKLLSLIKTLFNQAEKLNIKIKSAISPHAGYIYSGITASYVYKNLKQSYSRIILLGVSHHYTFDFACLDENEKWETPLGTIELDMEFEEKLRYSEVFRFDSTLHKPEHSIEVQVPFIQYKLGNEVKIVPILLGTLKREKLDKISEAIKKEIDDNSLIIASSDFYHGYSYNECKKINEISKDILEKGDPDEFFRNVVSYKIMACGAAGIYVMLKIYEKKKYHKKVLNMTTSGDITGDKTGYVVGYISFAYYE